MCEKGVQVPSRKVPLYTDAQLGACGYIPVQARVTEDTLIYISAHLQTISSQYYRSIKYEELITQPTRFGQPLADFLGFERDVVMAKVSAHIEKKKDYTGLLTERQREAVETIFAENRAQQWSFLLRDEISLISEKGSDIVGREETCLVPQTPQ